MNALTGRKINTVFVFALFTVPALAAIFLSVLVPFFMSIIYSFTKWNGLDKVPVFIGLSNYKELIFDDPEMVSSLFFTLRLTFLTVIFTNTIALTLAVFLDSDINGKNFLRAAFYIPHIVSLIVIGYIWKFIFTSGFDSLYNLLKWKIFQQSWLGDGDIAFVSVAMVSVWQAIGFYMVIYIAGLQTVPKELMEASMIDGASPLRRFFRITLPMIMPSVTVCVFYSLSNGLKAFDVIFSLTNGGPGTATMSIALDIYRTAFIISRFGYGTAKSVVLFLTILLLTFFQIKAFKRREVEL
ncbi:sugar ABC transporter permease [Marispirochaeta sp.]|jgi:raffinose/stachyose/melibiose transport system permease protein|uniref:carbohydrate ABC transporter permease n=1 Tax=Marispirochaeta sp. TaxID=2038653 RepID=UPI0029C9026D|nr:sugar ABC transporter permease [Marispirochaeta sp.]